MTQSHRMFLCLVLITLVPLPASAQTAPLNHDVMLQAKKCLRVPGVLSFGSYRASLVVTFEGGFPVETKTTELDPQGSSGRTLIEAVTKAIDQCGPYPGVADGAHTLAFESEE